jgi:hypothetical protein
MAGTGGTLAISFAKDFVVIAVHFIVYIIGAIFLLRDAYLTFAPLFAYFGLIDTDVERGIVPAGDIKG